MVLQSDRIRHESTPDFPRPKVSSEFIGWPKTCSAHCHGCAPNSPKHSIGQIQPFRCGSPLPLDMAMVVAVQYYVLPEKTYDAFYKLDNITRQVTSFVFDVVRAQVPKIKLDDVFEKKDDIANIVKSELAQVMDGFGYGILKALVTDIEPDSMVKESMNEINAAQRMRVAATERGEADRILKVKAAEGDAQSKALQGRGIADQRQAIVAGLRDSVDEFRRSVPGTTAKDVMNLVLMTQYFDMLKDIGASSRTNAILIPHSPGNLTALTDQLRNAMIEANQMVKGAEEPAPSLS